MTFFNNLGIITFIFLLYECRCIRGFAISSSQSSSKKLLSNKKKGAGGFGKDSSSVPIDHTADTGEATADLIHFLVSQKSTGITANEGLEIGMSDITGIRGVFATKAFKKNEIICKVPSDCALALSNPDLGGTDAPTLAHGGRNFLDMYKNNPIWTPYLNSLPSRDSHFDSTPNFFTDEEIEALEFPLAVNLAKKIRQEILDLSEEDGIPHDELQFATWLVSSRAFTISMEENDPNAPVDGLIAKPSKSIRVLVPYIDMINHSSDNANAGLHLIDPEKDEAWFAIKALRPIKAGKEITISYGTGFDTSVELLQNYGFVPFENKIDALMLKKGGEGIIETLDGWSTTLEEDENTLASGDVSDNMKKVLEFRIKLKKSYA